MNAIAGDWSASGPGLRHGCVVESYAPDRLIGGPVWTDVLRLLQSNRGVCAGVGGPRGSGKTWLLRYAAEWANRPNKYGVCEGVGVYFPSPSAYDASIFLSGLCQALATKTEANLRPGRSFSGTKLLDLANKRSVLIGTVLVIVGTVFYVIRNFPL